MKKTKVTERCPALAQNPSCTCERKCGYCINYASCETLLRMKKDTKIQKPPSSRSCFRCKNLKAITMGVECLLAKKDNG